MKTRGMKRTTLLPTPSTCPHFVDETKLVTVIFAKLKLDKNDAQKFGI